MTINFPNFKYPNFKFKWGKNNETTPSKVGVVFSGGGARGFAHLGVLQALHEHGIKVHKISGVSAGALAGALYAAGHSPTEILESFMDIRINRFFRPLIAKKGLLKLERVSRLLKKYLDDDFNSLNIPLSVAATDLQNSQLVYFTEGQLIKPLMASCCIPILFDPILIEEKLFVDGGVLNNFPVEPLQEECDLIIGVHANPFQDYREIKGIRSVMEHSFHLAVSLNVADRLTQCDLLIEPQGLKKYRLHKISKAEEIFKVGYDQAYEDLKKLKEENAHLFEG